MFKDNPNIEQIGTNVFVYRNFVPEELVKTINDKMATYELEDYKIQNGEVAINWYSEKSSKLTPELFPVWDMITELLAPEHCIHPNLSLLAMRPGDTMFVHSDSPGRDMEEDLTQPDRWNTCCIIEYGVCVYFGDYEGGEIYYPNISAKDGSTLINHDTDPDCLTYAAKPGDLVIHGSTHPWEHGVREVKSGIRYCYSNFSVFSHENPGTFPVPGSEEELSRRSDPGLWMTPLGEVNPETGVALTTETHKAKFGLGAPTPVDTVWNKSL